jgi:ABC-type uncharacterized transport system involved in gliding motility auxiliary subunit
MAQETDLRSTRRSRRLHGWLQAILAITLFVGLNHLLRNHPVEFDMTGDRRHTLSPEALSAIRQLEQPVLIVSTLREDDESIEIARAAADVRVLAQSMVSAAGGEDGRIHFRQIDPLRQRREAEQLGIDGTNVVMIQSGTNTRRVFLDELYETQDRRRTAFRGEQIFLSAILELTSDTRPVIYFVEGHGESSIRDFDPVVGLSQLAEFLRLRNFELRQLDLSAAGNVPADAALLVIVAPKSPVLPVTQEILRSYLSRRSGRMILMLPPSVQHGLDDLLWDWGVLADDALVVDTSTAFTSQTGSLVVRRLGDHPITRPLADNQLPVLFGFARPTREDPGRGEDAGLSVVTLLQTSDTAWGERDFRTSGRMTRDPQDLQGPFGLAVVSERTAASRAGIDLPGGRLVVFGTGDFVSNGKIAQLGNWRMFLNAVNWSLARDSALEIEPRPVTRLQLALTGSQQRTLHIWILGVIPGVIALLGLAVHLVRRT